MTLARTLLAVLRLLFWNWIASRWSGGGPRHRSYAHARWQAWRARMMIMSWLRRGEDA